MCNVVLVFSITDYRLHMYTSSVIVLYNSILFAHRALADWSTILVHTAVQLDRNTCRLMFLLYVHVHCIYMYM